MQTRFRLSLKNRKISCRVFRFIAWATVFAVTSTACHNLPENLRELYLPNKEHWTLLSPTDFGGKLDTVQKLSAEFNGQTAVMLMQLEIDKNSVRLAMLNPTMISLFSLEDNGEQIVTTRSPMIPDKIDPKYVLADIQLSYWPLAVLTPSLRRSGLNLTEVSTTTGKSRSLTNNNGEELVRIDYVIQSYPGPVAQELLQTVYFENFVWHYHYHIDTVSWDLQRDSEALH